MANPEHLAKLKEGIEAWNEWRKENSALKPDFSGANLAESDLRMANLKGADLKFAHLCEVKLFGADLSWADLSGANLNRMDLTGASIGATIFANVDLSGVKGLETVRHGGPSSIGIETIYMSQGKIPHIFLRGAGVPENFIDYMASMVASGIEYCSLFISHSTKDREFAGRLHNDLQVEGVRCWYAPHDIRSGKKIHEEIDEAIRIYDRLLLILSPASMESEWVKTEISKARKREIKEEKRILFPIRLCSFEALRDWECFDSDAGKDSAREIREYFIPDFSNWKDNVAYQKEFGKLLKALDEKPKPFVP